ncbi:MAG: hypothetical protein INF43_02795 [Alphaproteobacteria bacterium]|jgi:hypothetical protein|nr:hypothetical protein [Alphaproteobacteria bacterium]
MNALTFALSPEVLHGSLEQASARQLLAWARAYASKEHVYHTFGRRCAVELLCRDQFQANSNPSRSFEAENALIQLTHAERSSYGVYL